MNNKRVYLRVHQPHDAEGAPRNPLQAPAHHSGRVVHHAQRPDGAAPLGAVRAAHRQRKDGRARLVHRHPDLDGADARRVDLGELPDGGEAGALVREERLRVEDGAAAGLQVVAVVRRGAVELAVDVAPVDEIITPGKIS